jgi:Uma2 family endonuclease
VKGPFPRVWSPLGTVRLAVEVLSPTTARIDRGRKRLLYQREGVPEYWIVDIDAQIVERWRPGDQRPEVLTERIEWRPSETADALVVDVAALFADLEA